ncbi:MAG: hypothetical protein KatS3mg082_2143 [Nitrospiraceae bacterium]|nr:MAG: hypothetical protein KatS3mg082_2143 [Nitrospiraceae bacterium]
MVDVGWDGSGKSLVADAVHERTQLRQVGTGAKLVVFEAGNQLKWWRRR